MGKIYAVRMREYNKGEGCLRRNWTAGQWGLQFTAGDSTPRRPFRPSPIVEVTKEQYEYIMGRRADGMPNVGQPHTPSMPVFQGWIVDSRRELMEMVQKEADARAARGSISARAMLRLRGPIESERPVSAIIPPVTAESEKEATEEPEEVADVETSFQPMDVAGELAKVDGPSRVHSADPVPETEDEPGDADGTPEPVDEAGDEKTDVEKDGTSDEETDAEAEDEAIEDATSDDGDASKAKDSKPKSAKKKPGRKKKSTGKKGA